MASTSTTSVTGDANPVTTPRVKVLDKNTGIQVVKGGQTVYSGFLESVLNAYSNLCNSPTVLLFMVIVVIAAFAEINSTSGPIEVIKSNVVKMSSDNNNNKIVTAVGKVLIFLLDYVIAHKVMFIASSLLFIPYLAKPSRQNLTVTVILSLVCNLGGLPLWDVLLFSQMFFLYTQIRTPIYRTLILVIGVVVFVIGVEVLHASLQPGSTATPKANRPAKSTTPTPATPKP